MKTIKFFVLLVAVICFAACNKDKEELHHERDIIYTVDTYTTTVHLTTEAEWEALLDQFCNYAEEGSTVTFYNANSVATGAKDATHFSTTSRDEMKAWMRQMEEAGKTVTVTFDSGTGTYSGIAYATNPIDSHWVDLGLPSGLLWATCNVGADNPTDYGEYFAWGEIQPKNVYTQANYIHSNGSLYRLTKYCFREDWGDNGYTDTLTILEPCDDVATVVLGGDAYIPTRADWQELIDNTVGEWVVTDSLYGFGYWRFTAPNGNTLCLPAAGGKSDYGIPYGIDYCGCYWSSELDTVYPYPWNFTFRYIDSLNVGELNNNWSFSHRHMGHSVRAVRPRN